jgi:DNA-directed RNA polymerase subunit omega
MKKMIYPSIDKILNQIGSKYLLVNVVSERVNEMDTTNHYQLKDKEYKARKQIGRALEEVARDLIHLKQES